MNIKTRNVLIGIALALVSLWILIPIALIGWFDTMDERGQFGDMFGAVNALFTGAALLGSIYAIILQGHELELQTRVLSEQLQTMQEAFKFQRQKEEMEREPVVEGGIYYDTPGHVMRLTNRGAPVRGMMLTLVDPPDGIAWHSAPKARFWDHDETASYRIASAKGDKRRLQMLMSYVDLLGRHRQKPLAVSFEHETVTEQT